ncbi:MAG: superinfection immunity protein [bacterium]
MEGLVGVFGLVVVGLYFAPLIVAVARQHHQLGPIAVVDVCLGWTLIGWVVAMAMALSAPPGAQRRSRAGVTLGGGAGGAPISDGWER